MRIGMAAIGGAIALAVAGISLFYWVEQGSAPHEARVVYDRLGKALTGKDPRQRCFTTELQPDGLKIAHFVGSRACYEFLPPRRFSGVYVDEFEGQKFLEGAGETKRYVIPCRSIWFTVDEQSDVSRWKGFGARDDLSHVWLLDFVGRETPPESKDGYGHLRGSDGEVLVDRIISARLIGSYQGYSNTGADALVLWKEDCPAS